MGCSYYNGVLLPDLPSYDQEALPHALIVCVKEYKYVSDISAEAMP